MKEKLGYGNKCPFMERKKKCQLQKNTILMEIKKTTANDMQNNLCSKNQYAEN